MPPRLVGGGRWAGWEYLSSGSLGAAVSTHALYDFVAFVYLVNEYKTENPVEER